MVIAKSFMELKKITGGSFEEKLIDDRETGLACYVIDAKMTDQHSAPDMEGIVYKDMIETCWRHEFGDLKQQPSPIFYFTGSKNFVMNLLPSYFASGFESDDAKAGAGIFGLSIMELFDQKSDKSRGEFQYDTNTTIHPAIKGMDTRGVQQLPNYLQNGAFAFCRPADFGYTQLDTTAVDTSKEIKTTNWLMGGGSGNLKFTRDSTFKISAYGQGRGDAGGMIMNSQTASDPETSVRVKIDGDEGIASFIPMHSCQTESTDSLTSYMKVLASKITVPDFLFYSDRTNFATSKVMSPSVIADGDTYIAFTNNSYGLGKILTATDIEDAVTDDGKTAYITPGLVRYSNNGTALTSYAWRYPMRVVAKSADLAGKTSIIEIPNSDGVTVVKSEAFCYKVNCKNSYLVFKASNGVDTQQDQTYITAQGLSGNRLRLSGIMQSLKTKSDEFMADLYSVGIFISYNGGFIDQRIYILYDDNSLKVTSKVSSSDSEQYIGIKVSSDGKNLTSDHSLMDKQYKDSILISAKANIIQGFADGQPIGGVNSGTKKIVAVGLIMDNTTAQSLSNTYPYFSTNTCGTFITLSKKT